MFSFLLNRLAILVPIFFGVSLVSFSFIRILPGDPVETIAGERGVTPEMARILQSLSYSAYDDFIELVSRGREMTPEAVEKIAGGLVWTGSEAAEVGLVDELGGLNEAIAAAAMLAGVESWRTGRTSVPPSFESVLLEELSRSFDAALPVGWGWTESLVASFKPVVRSLSALRDPMHIYVQCLSCAPVP